MRLGTRLELFLVTLADIEESKGPAFVTTTEVTARIWSELVEVPERARIVSRAAAGDKFAQVALKLVHGAERYDAVRDRTPARANSDRRWAVTLEVINPSHCIRLLERMALLQRRTDARRTSVQLTDLGREVAFARRKSR